MPIVIAITKVSNSKLDLLLSQGHWQCYSILKGHSLGLYDFVLVFHCNYVAILHRFWDVMAYFPKRKLVTWLWPSPLNFHNCKNTSINLRWLNAEQPDLWRMSHVAVTDHSLQSLRTGAWSWFRVTADPQTPWQAVWNFCNSYNYSYTESQSHNNGLVELPPEYHPTYAITQHVGIPSSFNTFNQKLRHSFQEPYQTACSPMWSCWSRFFKSIQTTSRPVAPVLIVSLGI